MVINTNASANSSSRLLSASSSQLSKSLARLSSGSKITSPSDDVAGQAVSMRFDAQINRIDAATTNLSNANSFAQTQDGYLGKVNDAFNRMSELSVLSQDATKSDSDRALYDQEFQTLGSYVNDLATKDFNGVSLFNGSTLSITKDSDANAFSMTGVNLGGTSYTAATGADVKTQTGAAAALTKVKNAITQLATDRATVGANVSRLNMYSDQLGVLKDNLASADSNIKDVDVATESTQYAKYNILVQSGVAMLSQANSLPQYALKLLG